MPSKPLTSDDERHGTIAGYGAGCTQECCRKAWSDYKGAMQKKNGKLNPEANEKLLHGRPSTYTNHRCRCDLCRKAYAEKRPSRRKS